MNTLVSIIVPAYQQEKRIGRCLESVLSSSYSNYEVIVVNDGSTDRTAKIVQAYIEKTKQDKPVIKLVNISHGGLPRARNIGLRHTQGQFIGFLDADDMLHPQMIERLVKSMLKGSDLAACGLLICDENGKPARWQYPLNAQYKQCPIPALQVVMWDQILMSVSPAFFRREKILDKQGTLLIDFPEELVDFEDFAFICKYLCACDGVFEVIPFYGILYCKHAGSLTTEIHTVYEIRQAMQQILKIGETAGTNDFTAHKIQYAFRFMAFWYKEAHRCEKKDFSPCCESWKVCMRELERYADFYMNSNNVDWYRKLAMWIVRKHPEIGRIMAKTIGRKIL